MNRGSAEILPFVPSRAEQDPAYAGAPALKTLLNRAFGGLIPLQRRPTCLGFATIMLLISCSPWYPNMRMPEPSKKLSLSAIVLLMMAPVAAAEWMPPPSDA